MSSSSASSNALTSCGHSFMRSQRPTSACASEVVAAVASVGEAGAVANPSLGAAESFPPHPAATRHEQEKAIVAMARSMDEFYAFCDQPTRVSAIRSHVRCRPRSQIAFQGLWWGKEREELRIPDGRKDE